jgi:hypothetical protein
MGKNLHTMWGYNSIYFLSILNPGHFLKSREEDKGKRRGREGPK